jgi:quercetin dioxygenase-like cupin family protein
MNAVSYLQSTKRNLVKLRRKVMTQPIHYSAWQETIQYGEAGPNPQKIIETDNFRTVMVGLKADQKVPIHPAPASTYYFLSGTGQMFVGDETFAIQAGAIVVVPDGATRGIHAETDLAFLGAQAAQISNEA